MAKRKSMAYSNEKTIEKLISLDGRYFSEFIFTHMNPEHCPYHNNNHNGNGRKSSHCDLTDSPASCSGFWYARNGVSPLDGIISGIELEFVCEHRRKLDID
jgi:hypothetical protein